MSGGRASTKRLGPRTTGEADRLPDFIFGRDRASEKAGGFVLAGRLLTPFPKKLSKGESDEIAALTQVLMDEVKRDPNLQQVGCWRKGASRPPDALKPPFPVEALIARMNRCAWVVVRVDPRNDGFIRIDDVTMADIMGRN